MIQEHLAQLRSKLEQEPGLPETTKAELLKLVAAVEIETLGGAGNRTDVAASDAEDADGQGGLGKLAASVEELEASHPELAASINQVAITLSKMGI